MFRLLLTVRGSARIIWNSVLDLQMFHKTQSSALLALNALHAQCYQNSETTTETTHLLLILIKAVYWVLKHLQNKSPSNSK